MIEIVFKLLNHQALDEWNERTIAILVLLLIGDFLRRLFGRTQFRFELSSVAKKWLEHKAERNGGTAVATNPHPRLSVLLEELVDELRNHRNENDEQFREMRNDMDEQLRDHRREVREDMEQELKIIRNRLGALEQRP